MDEPVIEITSLVKSFSATRVLEEVNLSVPRGQTFAFLGRNGAGKTTTIRTLLGLLKPDGGRVRVLGLDPARQAMEVRRQVGYLAEDQAMFPWMRVEQLLSFMAPFYPTWNREFAAHLLERFELPRKTKVKHLSKGQSVRLGLLLALAHQPRLVILDDPTLGLDPIMRKEFLRDVVTFLQGTSVTVFFSSHLLYEVEPVADAVAILDKGKIVRCAPTETLREQVRRLILPAWAFDAHPALPGVLDIKRRGNQIVLVVENVEQAMEALRGYDVQNQPLNLDEIFEAYVIGQREENHDPRPAVERVA